jgi:hypothetical protein
LKKLAPIILFVYNRPEHTKQALEYLKKNNLAKDSVLFIFSDGPKNENDKIRVNNVREIIHSINGFKDIQIKEQNSNLGLAKSILSGVTEIFQTHNKAIVMEDDVVSAPDFLYYMNELLDYYRENEKIFSVTGYTFPIKISSSYKNDLYFSPRASSWGWGTWKNRWERVDWEINDYESFIANKSLTKAFDNGGGDLTKMLKNRKSGKIDSWAIIWTYAHFKNNSYCVYPVKSRIKNIGADLSGVHTNRTKRFDVELDVEFKPVKPVEKPYLDDGIMRNFKSFFRKRLINAIYNKILIHKG